jgi:hypothetical protein
MDEDKPQCPLCFTWGFNEPMPEFLKAENFRWSNMCSAHRGPKPKQRKRKGLTQELNRAFTWWLISMEEKGLKPSTVKTNRRAAAQFARWWIDQMPEEEEEY